jgi:hypothetical protein
MYGNERRIGTFTQKVTFSDFSRQCEVLKYALLLLLLLQYYCESNYAKPVSSQRKSQACH